MSETPRHGFETSITVDPGNCRYLRAAALGPRGEILGFTSVVDFVNGTKWESDAVPPVTSVHPPTFFDSVSSMIDSQADSGVSTFVIVLVFVGCLLGYFRARRSLIGRLWRSVGGWDAVQDSVGRAQIWSHQRAETVKDSVGRARLWSQERVETGWQWVRSRGSDHLGRYTPLA
jgi:hypothetical protein